VKLVDAMWGVLLELAPFLLLGMAVAGLLHVLLPRSFVHRQLRGRLGVVKAVLVGVPLPLCSCGVIPAGFGLRKDGASRGAVVGFLISTPQTGVDSILVSASFLGWPFAIFKVAAAAVTGLVGGFVTDAVDGRAASEEQPPPPAAESIRGWRAMADHALEILRTIWRWVVVGVVASAAISTLVPPGAFEAVAGRGAVLSVLLALVVSLPLYVCATASVPIAAALVAGGFPAGAALVFLMAGPATNLATVGAIRRFLGGRALAVYLLAIVVGSVGLGMTFDFLVEGVSAAAAHVHGSASWWKVASAVLLLALLSWFAFDDLRGWLARRGAATIEDGEQVIELGVDGMSCQGCVKKLETALRGQPGVRAVDVSLEQRKARVSGRVDEQRVKQVIVDVGFTPSTN